MSFKLYSSLFSQYQKEFLIYRLKILIVTISQFVSPLVMMIVLSSIPGKSFNGMTSAEIINYYIFTSLLYLFMNSKIDSFVKSAILDGGLASFLIKPVNFWLVCLTKDLSGRFTKLFIGLPVIFLLFFIYYKDLQFGATLNVFLLMLTLLLGYLLSFLISFGTGLLAFFIEEIWGLQNLKDIVILLLSGVALPYKYFPVEVANVLKYTPFPYIVNWPLRAGFTGNILVEIIVALVWLIVIFILCLGLWKKGIRKYSGMGAY